MKMLMSQEEVSTLVLTSGGSLEILAQFVFTDKHFKWVIKLELYKLITKLQPG